MNTFQVDSILDHISGGIFNGRKMECSIIDCKRVANVNTIFGLVCMNHDRQITAYRNGTNNNAGSLKLKSTISDSSVDSR